jgi:hypothetical protein
VKAGIVEKEYYLGPRARALSLELLNEFHYKMLEGSRGSLPFVHREEYSSFAADARKYGYLGKSD